MTKLIAIALSGGLDSLVAGYLLKQQGYSVTGIHFITGYEIEPLKGNSNRDFPGFNDRISFIKTQARDLISHIENQIGIKIELINIHDEFKKKVVEYFIETYKKGLTPNPCMVCNPQIKFDTLFYFAKCLGSVRLATGHYARILKDKKGRFHLLKGLDKKKDQSYFLALLSQKQLSSICFPLGEITKSEVKNLAKQLGITPYKEKESQDICFIKDNSYSKFLEQQDGFIPEPGMIKDIDGNILGKHKGLHHFTIGQRRGINKPSTEPYYVTGIDQAKNRLIVGRKKDLFSSKCNVVGINWINRAPNKPVKVKTRVRYRHTAASSTVFPVDNKNVKIHFDKPQSAITPGQCAVFYQNDEVLGGGWITLK